MTVLFDRGIPGGTTAGAWLREARDRLADAGIESAALDARMLLIDGLGIPHSVFIADPQFALQPDELQKLEEMMRRRLEREPVSRILAWREFYGCRFEINEHVLDPRPDTETLVSAALTIAGNRDHVRVLDLGTGSGCIAITLLAERRSWSASATDVSPDALQIAKKNAEALRIYDRLDLIETSWADGIDDSFDLIVSNPPYIPSGEIPTLMPEVAKFDPHAALDGGEDGLAAYRMILAASPALLRSGGHLVLEAGHDQAESIYALADTGPFSRTQVPDLEVNDLTGIERVVVLEYSP